MTLRHRFEHWLGINTGDVESFWEGDVIMMGFRCHGCKGLFHVEPCVCAYCRLKSRAKTST